MRRSLTLLLTIACVAVALPDARTQVARAGAVVFVHGMGASAADQGTEEFADLLRAIASRYPNEDACQDDAQPGRPWRGSPCVFRYVDDAAETDGGFNDSQSAVRDNADKLAREIDEVARNTGRRVVLAGYSMGGAIIRTYLAIHAEQARSNVAAVIFVDAVASGSWGYQFAGAVPRRVGGPLGDRITELLRSLARSSANVNFDRPATRDLSPRSALYREIARMPLPRNVSYYTFSGDIRIVLERHLLGYPLPDFRLPSVGDLGLLPGNPDPKNLPEFGGQRFSPRVDDANVALDIPHRARIELDARTIADLIASCSHRTSDVNACRSKAASLLAVPNTHTAVPNAMDEVRVESDVLGGDVTLLEAVLAAIGRHR